MFAWISSIAVLTAALFLAPADASANLVSKDQYQQALEQAKRKEERLQAMKEGRHDDAEPDE